MTETWKTIKASEASPGDTIRSASGVALLVARIEEPFMGRDGMLAFIEDNSDRWFKMPCPIDAEIEVLVEPSA
jgi:hypothetical protein